MNKQDWLWVIIRAFGIYCVIQLVLLLPSTVTSAIFLVTIGDLPHTSSLAQSPEAIDSMNTLMSTAMTAIRSTHHTAVCKGTVSLLLWGIVSWYLMCRGFLLFNVLNRTTEKKH